MILFHLYFSPSRFGGKDAEYEEFTVAKCYIYLCSTLTMRGWSDLPSKLAAKIAVVSLIFFGTMLWWYWEAMLLAYLATRTVSLPFKDLSDLVTNTEFRIILLSGSLHEAHFRTSKDSTWQAAWTDRVEPYLEEFVGYQVLDPRFTDKIVNEELTAWYDIYIGAM